MSKESLDALERELDAEAAALGCCSVPACAGGAEIVFRELDFRICANCSKQLYQAEQRQNFLHQAYAATQSRAAVIHVATKEELAG